MKGNKDICQKCKNGCCKFKQTDLNFLPKFSKEELDRVIKVYGRLNSFEPYKNSNNVFQVKVLKSKKGSYYICPFYNEETCLCKIYQLTPLDCRLWPFFFIKKENDIVLVCFDKDCCQITDSMNEKEFDMLKKETLEQIEKEKILDLLKIYPDLVWDYNEGWIFDVKRYKLS